MDRPPEWDAYERAIMEGRGEEAKPPGDDYEMSETFKQWIVDKMRDEVMGQISGAGLDRMAIVKPRPDVGDASDGETTTDEAAGGDASDAAQKSDAGSPPTKSGNGSTEQRG